MSDKAAIVIDNGSSVLRIGYGGSDVCECVIPTVVGSEMHSGVRVILIIAKRNIV